MINGKLGWWLVVAMLIWLPIDKWKVAGLGVADAFVILLMLVTWPLVWRNRIRVHVPLALGAWLILTGSLFGFLSNLNSRAAGLAIVQEVYLFLLFVTIVNAFTDRGTLLRFTKVWATVAVAESIIVLLGRKGISVPFLTGGVNRGKMPITELGVESGTQLSEIGRSVGSFVNANAAGGFLMGGLFILLAVAYPQNRLLRTALVVLVFAAIIATGSNGALLGTITGLIVAGFYWCHQHGRTALFAVGIGAVITAVVILSLPFVSSVTQSAGKESALFAYSRVEDKLGKRFNLWSSGMALFKQHPLGIGPNVSASVIEGGLHNDFVAFMTERGILGFIGLMVLIGELLFWLLLAGRNGTMWNHHLMTGALWGGLIAIWTMALGHEVTHSRGVWLLFALIFLHSRFLQAEAGQPESMPALQPRLGVAQ